MTPWTVARQVPLSMEFSRQEYWSGLPFPSPEDLPDTGIFPGGLNSGLLQHGDLLQELSLRIMKAENARDLPSASWRTRRTSAAI